MAKFTHNWQAAIRIGLLGLAALAVSASAHASMTLLVEQPYGKLGLVDPGGHAALYLDRICAETPTKLRPCGPGELGVVISRYDGINHLDWVAIPLIPYLYAVESDSDIPTSIDKTTEDKLRDEYRRKHLESLAQDKPDGSAPGGNWYELIGSSYDRTIFGFRVDTTTEQDAMTIAVFNDEKNTERYNGFYRNCADFVRVAINRVYPHAIGRNYIADLGVTSPKWAARELTHYAHKHPESGLDVFVIPQIPGLSKSRSNTGVLEGIVRRYSIPLVFLSPQLEGVAVAAYVSHGRFVMPKDAPKLNIAELQKELEEPRLIQPELRQPMLPDPQMPVVKQGTAEAVASTARTAPSAASAVAGTAAAAVPHPAVLLQ